MVEFSKVVSNYCCWTQEERQGTPRVGKGKPIRWVKSRPSGRASCREKSLRSYHQHVDCNSKGLHEMMIINSKTGRLLIILVAMNVMLPSSVATVLQFAMIGSMLWLTNKEGTNSLC